MLLLLHIPLTLLMLNLTLAFDVDVVGDEVAVVVVDDVVFG